MREARYDVVVLPWGATEAHNTHLPYATDVVEASEVAIAAAAIAWERGARVVVLPPVPFGVKVSLVLRSTVPPLPIWNWVTV